MGGMQTILALLAVTLFSTLTLGSYNNLTSQGDILYSSYLNILGQNVAKAYFEKMTCELVGNFKTLNDIYTSNHTKTDTVIINNLSDWTPFVSFQRHLNSYYCNDDGSTSTTPTDNVKITMYMVSQYGKRKIYVGTPTNPLVRLFTDSGLN